MFTAKVITVSDRCWRGEREDRSGPAVCELLAAAGYALEPLGLVPDEQDRIAEALIEAAAADIALIVTTGGTGFAPRDVTPEATIRVCERLAPGRAAVLVATAVPPSRFTVQAPCPRGSADCV